MLYSFWPAAKIKHRFGLRPKYNIVFGLWPEYIKYSFVLRPDVILKGVHALLGQERLQHIARKTHTSVQSVLEVAASCVLEFQKTHSEHNNEDSMEGLSEQEDPSDHIDGT